MIEIIPVGKPELVKGIGSYTFTWPDVNISIRADRLTDDGVTELSFYRLNGTGQTTLHICRANLLSTTMIGQLTKRLQANLPIDWQTALTYVTRDVLTELRSGVPTEDVGQAQVDMDIKYQIWPLIQVGQPTTVFGPGESAKTLLAQAIALCVQAGKPILNWHPLQANVLYLDWEAQSSDHRRRVWAIKQGMEFPIDCVFSYQWHSHPLIDVAASVRRTIEGKQIGLVIVDSQMAAMGRSAHGRTDADLTAEYYECLRSFGCSSLTIDHVNKADWKNVSGETGPYGSVVKFNRSRIQFELQKKQEPGNRTIDLTLIQRKINEGMHLADQGIRIIFESEAGKLAKIIFSTLTVESKAGKEPTVGDLCYAAMREHGPQTVNDLALYLDADEHTIRKALSRDTRRFSHEGKLWIIN